jgi:hypothetical protein
LYRGLIGSHFLLALWLGNLGQAAEVVPRLVTVRDSIEMTKLADPHYVAGGSSRGRVAVVSPNGQQILVVLRRGDVKSNTNVYSMQLWNRAKVLTRDVSSRTLLEMTSSSNLPAISSPVWSDDNETITFIGESGEQRQQVFEYSVRTGHLTQLTRHPSSVVAFSRAAQSPSLTYVAERPDASLWDPETDARGLVVSDQFLSDLMVGRKSSQFRGKQDEVDLFVQDSRGVRSSHFSGQLGRSSSISMSPDGNWVVAAIQMARSDLSPSWLNYDDYLLRFELGLELSQDRAGQSLLRRYEILDTRTGRSHALLGAPTSTSLETTAVWIDSGTSLVLNSAFLPIDIDDPIERSARVQRPHTVEVNPAAGALTRIGEHCRHAVHWDRQARELICIAQPNESSELIERYRQILARQEAGVAVDQQLHTREDGSIRTVRFQKLGNQWQEVGPAESKREELEVYLREDMNLPPKIYARRVESADDILLADLNPQFRDLRLGKVEEITWEWSAGQPIQGGLYYPPDYRPGTRYPLVIQTHDWNPFRFWIDGPWTTAYAAQALAARGIVVLQLLDEFVPESFGMDGQLKEVEKAVAIYRSAIDHLSARGLIDKSRTGVIGFSHTCFYVKYALAHDPSLFAVASVAEGEDGGYMQFITGMNYYVDANSLYGGGPFGPTLARWVERSPGFGLHRVQAPLRITVLNPRFVLAEWEWFAGLKHLQKPVELVMLRDGEHVLEKPSERLVSQEGNVDWFDFWLNGHEDPDSAKAPQYVRWRALRKSREANSGS